MEAASASITNDLALGVSVVIAISLLAAAVVVWAAFAAYDARQQDERDLEEYDDWERLR